MAQENTRASALLTNVSIRNIAEFETKTRLRLFRRLRLIKNVSLIMAIMASLATLLTVLYILNDPANNPPTFFILGCLFVAACFVTFLVAQPRNKLKELSNPAYKCNEVELKTLLQKGYQKADIASFIFLFFLIFVEISTQLSLNSGNDGSLTAGFLLIPVISVLLGLNRQKTILTVSVGGVALLGSFIYSGWINKWPTFYLTLGNWILLYAICAVCITVFTARVDETLLQEENQAEQLKNVVLALNSTNQASAELGQEMIGVTNELNQTANSHFASNQEQVAAITEVTSSLEELNETAQQIANSATSAATETARAVEIANQVKDTSQVAQTTSREGSQAVEQTIVSVERVRNRIELLGQRLLNLTEQTRRVGNIIDIIDEIADETHLLALNASIEAAGNITTGTTALTVSSNGGGRTTVRGERFGVIAQEIKNLSDRSREATEEVRQAISEMQGAVAAAVLVAEEGKKETAAAVSRSQIAGAVIGKLDEVIVASSSSADQILYSVGVARERCEEISLATNQQKSANQQILMTMRNITTTSQESSRTVGEFMAIIGRIDRKVGNLNEVLVEATGQSKAVLAT